MKRWRTRALSGALSMVLAVGGAAAVWVPNSTAADADPMIYMDASGRYSFEERAADLVSRMTLEEKISHMANSSPAIGRLGVSGYNFWSEALHGVARSGEATSFPYAISMAASWDAPLIEQIATAISDEARGYNNGKGKGLSYWSPTINMARDPRWGRNHESYGEDPFLTTQIGTAFVDGMQGDDTTYYKTIATIKHYAANNREKGRNSISSDMEDTVLREYYTRAFKGIVQQSRVGSVMSAYNAVNGIPCSANTYLLDTLLRRTFGFDGYITSDCGAIGNVYADHKWKPDGMDRSVTAEEAVNFCLLAGCDVDCGNVYSSYALNAVKQGILSENTLDVALTRTFTGRMRTGEFDPADMVPYRSAEYAYDRQVENAAHKQLAEDSADDAIVLLKNNGVLPLDRAQQKKIVMIGEIANQVVLGDYSGTPTAANTTTPIQGMENLGADVTYIEGGSTSSVSGTYICNLKNILLHKADGTTVTLKPTMAQDLKKCRLEGTNNVGDIVPGATLVFKNVNIKGLTSVTFELAGDKTVRPGTVTMTMDSTSGMQLASVKTAQTGGWQIYQNFDCAVSDLGGYEVKDLYIAFNDVKQDVSFSESQQKAIREADAVVVCLDGNGSGEGADRSSIALPAYQSALVNTAAGLNPRTIAYLQTVGLVELEEIQDSAAAILWTCCNGQAQGNAMARVLYGVANPTAKLPFTWYAKDEQLPEITDYEIRGIGGKTGWTYQYYQGEQTYPFGYGLSYSTYTYKNLQVEGGSCQLGDVDRDGTVSVTDALMVLQVAAGKLALTDAQRQAADADQNNTVTAGDALLILRAATRQTSLPAVATDKGFTPNDTLTATVEVTNTSGVDGREAVQLYVASPQADGVKRPLKQLKAFDKVSLKAGETKTVTLQVNLADCYFWDEDKQHNVYDQGTYTLFVGPSSDEATALKTTFHMDGQLARRLAQVTLEGDAVVLNAANPDKVIHTTLSAAMNDDSFYDLQQASVTYQSSDTTVATVDADGVVRPVGTGAATITASVTVDGQTMTGSIPVSVILQLNQMMLGDEPLKNFRADTMTYYVPLEKGTTPPAVTVPGLPAEYVTIRNAAAVPGKTTVAITMGKTTTTYTIVFTERSESYTAATFSGLSHREEGRGGKQIYFDWRYADQRQVDLTHYDLDDLHLRFRLDVHQLDDSKVDMDRIFAKGEVKLRSADDNGENNVGWKISTLNLHEGTNYVDLPLTQPTDSMLGTLDWTRIQRAMLTIQGLWDYKADFEATIADMMIVDSSLDPAREELWSYIREEIIDAQYVEKTLPPYYAAKEAIAAVLFDKEPLAADTAQNLKQQFLAAKEGLVKDTYLVGRFSQSDNTFVGNSKGGLYDDWKKGDYAPYDLSGDRSALRLQLKVTFASTAESIPAGNIWNQLVVKLRSPDLKGKPGDTDKNNSEHNYGWFIRKESVKDRENVWLSIDLSSACNNKRGVMDWSQVERLIVYADLSDQAKQATDLTDPFRMTVAQAKIVDLTNVWAAQKELMALLQQSVTLDGATEEARSAYTDAKAAAQALVDTEYATPTQLDEAQQALQQAIAALA